MKKKLWVSIVLLLAALIVWAIIYTYPQQHTFTIQGVMYQLGEENSDFVKPATIFVNGKMKKSILGVRTFTGIIDIKGENIPVPEEQRKLKIRLRKYGEADLFYSYFENGQVKHFSYGGIFINDDFSKIAIFKYKRANENPNQSGGGWNAGNGYMISAPAQKRDDALEISNELMHDYLQGYTLK